MIKGLRFLLIVWLVGCSSTASNKQEAVEKEEVKKLSDDLKWSDKMALTIMQRHPRAYQIDDRTEAKWDYVHGLVLTSFQALSQNTNDDQYAKYAEQYADFLINEEGKIATYRMDKYNIDMINAGKILFDIYERSGNKKYMTAMQVLKKQLEGQPRTPSGGFWHKKIYPNQMWLDGLYMGAPFYTRYTVMYEDGAGLDDIARQFSLIQEHAIDKKTRLLYHGWDESKQMDWADKTTGTSPNFWSRSMGWYAMALVDVLTYFPEEHPGHEKLVGYLNQLAEALVPFQHESGLWYQVTDQGDREGNYLEASGSSMFAYSLAKGANEGYLPASFKEVANKAFDGLINELMEVSENGEVTLTQVCQVAGLGGNPYRDGSYEYYVNERKKDNDPKATGPFIMAAIQLNR